MVGLRGTTARGQLYRRRQSQNWVSGLQQILRQLLDFATGDLNYQQQADENQQLDPARIHILLFF